MYIYEYERVSTDMDGYNLIAGAKYGTQGHREIINKRAKAGWRYIGYIPTKQRGTGHIEEMDFIFEKEVSKSEALK